MTPQDFIEKYIVGKNDWLNDKKDIVANLLTEYHELQSAKDKERIKLLDEMLQQNGINSLTGKPYINQKDKERIAELEKDVERIIKDRDFWEIKAYRSLKLKNEELTAEVERLKKENSELVEDLDKAYNH